MQLAALGRARPSWTLGSCSFELYPTIRTVCSSVFIAISFVEGFAIRVCLRLRLRFLKGG